MRKLFRSRDHRVVAGVAGGLAEYFNIDVALIRLVWILLLLAGGTGFLVYIIAAIIIPEEPIGGSDGPTVTYPGPVSGANGSSAGSSGVGTGFAGEPTPSDVKVKRYAHDGPAVGGWVLVGLGLYFLAHEFLPWFALGKLWPLILVLAGVGVLAGAFRR